MSNSSVPVGDTGDFLQTYLNTVSGALVHSEAVTPTDQTGAPFTAANPFPVSGPLTDTQLRATAVPVSVATFDRRNNPAATLLNAQPSATTDAVIQIDGDGALEQFGYLCRATSGTAVDAASWEVTRLRRIGPESASTAAYSRSGTTVTVTLTDHNLLVGDLAYIKSATDTGLNGYQKVATVAAGSFTFTTSSTGTATGTMTVKAGNTEMRYRSGVALTALEAGW